MRTGTPARSFLNPHAGRTAQGVVIKPGRTISVVDSRETPHGVAHGPHGEPELMPAMSAAIMTIQFRDALKH